MAKLYFIIDQILTYFVITDATLASDNKNRDEKLQDDINTRTVKISALSSGKIDKYEYLKGEEMLPFDQIKVIEKAKFAYSPLGRSF